MESAIAPFEEPLLPLLLLLLLLLLMVTGALYACADPRGIDRDSDYTWNPNCDE
mgnify:CR=1 FL=1